MKRRPKKKIKLKVGTSKLLMVKLLMCGKVNSFKQLRSFRLFDEMLALTYNDFRCLIKCHSQAKHTQKKKEKEDNSKCFSSQ